MVKAHYGKLSCWQHVRCSRYVGEPCKGMQGVSCNTVCKMLAGSGLSMLIPVPCCLQVPKEHVRLIDDPELPVSALL
jgi:hypothetical protein